MSYETNTLCTRYDRRRKLSAIAFLSPPQMFLPHVQKTADIKTKNRLLKDMLQQITTWPLHVMFELKQQA